MATLQQLRQAQKQEIQRGPDGEIRVGKQTLQEVMNSVPRLSLSQSRSTDSALKGAKPECPLCGDMGQLRMDVPVGHPDFGKLVRCPCKAAEDSARLQKISSMTDEERSWRLGDIMCAGEQRKGTRAMVGTCREFLGRASGILTIWGTCGNAKSHALCGMVNEMIENGNEAVYVLAFDLINYIRKAYSEKDNSVMDDDAYSRLLRFAGVRFLAVDELDKVFPISYWEGKQLTQFFDMRYRFGLDEQRGTVIAMNREPSILLEEQYHILSRLKDGRNQMICNKDEDMRPAMKSYGDPEDDFDRMLPQ